MARSGASIGAPVAMLNATCSFAIRQRSVAMDPWILDPRIAGETHNFLSTPLSLLRAGPPKFRRISVETRTHPNFEKAFAKLGPGPKREASIDDEEGILTVFTSLEDVSNMSNHCTHNAKHRKSRDLASAQLLCG